MSGLIQLFGFDEATGYDADDIGLANEGAIAGAKMIQSWFQDGLIPVGMTGDYMNGAMRDGKVGMVITGPWALPDYTAALGDKLKVAPIPTIDGNPAASFSGVKGWFVSEYSENKYWATDLALFITNAQSSVTYFDIAGEIPARDDITIDDELRNGILAQAAFAQPMPNIPEMSQVWGPINDALGFISQGEPVDEVLAEAVELIKEKNIDINIILFNNEIYGLTKGQYSPTTKKGRITKTSPMGTIETSFNPGELAIGAQGKFLRGDGTWQSVLTSVPATSVQKWATDPVTYFNSIYSK